MVPATAHFIWFGESLPFLYRVAVRSAALRGGFSRVVLHCEERLVGTDGWDYLSNTPGFSHRCVDETVFTELGGTLGPDLAHLFQSLSAPAAKANMVRAAILMKEGGVYLDTDTITIGDLTELRKAAGFFCGEERIVFPGDTTSRKGLRGLARAGALLGLRDFYRRLPNGWRGFRAHEHHFALAANNAVMGAEPGHPFVLGLLEAMVAMPPERQQIRFALGTHLLQAMLDRSQEDDVLRCDAGVFYPIAPEISQHWFRKGSAAELGEMLLPETKVVHWYASVRTKEIVPGLRPQDVWRDRNVSAILRLASEFVD